MKKLLLFLFFGYSITLFSQRKYSKEINFTNDNDLYVSTKRDRYYSNGMFFSYRFISNFNNEKVAKRTYEFQIGHHIYTPFKAVVQSVSLHDRPFAGYLFANIGASNFYKDNSVLKLSTQVGVVGPSAFGKELMDIVHDIYGFTDAVGWKYQIKNAFALNFEATYVKPLISSKSKTFDISWYNNAKVGTIFNDISTGLYGRIGFKPLQNLVNSIAFNGNLNRKDSKFNNEAEVFFYVKPLFSYVAYDTTIQGSMFNNDSPVTFDVKPFKFSTEFGLRFTSNRFNFGYSVFYHSKKLKSVNVPKAVFYGSIQINYQFN